MLTSVIFTICIAYAFAAPKNDFQMYTEAEYCNPNICKLPNCHCPSSNPPGGLNPSEIPQIVLLTFDDAVSVLNIDYYKKAFYGKRNPDGCPVGTTYFVTHEYTDYSKVHDLWARGHEIALHSITHQPPTDYWASLSVDGYMREFSDQLDLVSKFANIPRNNIQGIRVPFLQLSGDNSFKMIKKANLKYDCSWPTQTYMDSGLWPYTLDYKSIQDCPVGPCPTSSIPGVWVVPMVDWRDQDGIPCAMMDSCAAIPNKTEPLVNFMIENFNRHYKGSRSPFGFFVHAAWFNKNPDVHFPAYLKFVEYLQGLKDVYLVTVQRALQWIQNPSTLHNLKKSWPSCQSISANTCGNGKSCRLMKDQEERYMTVCNNKCPLVYPWLHNPLGN